DPIIGFVTRGHGVSVHRGDCPNADNLRRDQNRIIEVEWDTSGPSVFAVTIQVEALDRTKLLRDITQVLSDHHVTIMSAQVATGEPTGEIGPGLLVLVGVTHGDTEADAGWLAAKVAALRVFDDGQGKMNRSLPEVGGAALVVSQFTLYGNAGKGRRPSYVAA